MNGTRSMKQKIKPIYILLPYLKQQNNHHFRDLVQDTIDQLRTEQIGTIECHVADILEVAQQLVQDGCQILLSTGATAHFLEKKLSIDVFSIRTGAFDVIQAISQLKTFKKIALLTNASNFNFAQYADIFSIKIQQFSYDSYLSAKNTVLQIKAQQFEAVIGSPLAVELALSHGLSGQLLISQHALHEVLQQALQRLDKIQQQNKQQQLLSEIFDHLQEGICFLSPTGKIQFANQALLNLLELDRQQLIWQPITHIFKEIDLKQKQHTQRMIQYAQKKVIITYREIHNQHLEGWVLTAQELRVLEKSSSELHKFIDHQFECRYQFSDLITQDESFLQQIELAKHYAQTESTVLITGESGTGKEMIAQSMHRYSSRQSAPFVAINCAAFPENLLESELFGYEEGAFTGARKNGKRGLIEMADQGTLFLDEIGDLPLHLQTRLLRVLQERRIYRLGALVSRDVNIRVIAATHAPLEQWVQQDKFRSDLYYRLNILRIFVPSLQQRAKDIPLLVQHFFIHKGFVQADLPQFLLQALYDYTWPGNIRELENMVARLVILMQFTPQLSMLQFKQHLPEIFKNQTDSKLKTVSLKQLKRTQENMLIEQVLQETQGNLDLTAEKLAISRTTLWRRMKNKS